MFLNFARIRFPVGSLASIGHRISGVLLVLALPFAVLALDRSLMTQMTSAHLTNMMDDRYFELERLHGEEGSRLAAQSHGAATSTASAK